MTDKPTDQKPNCTDLMDALDCSDADYEFLDGKSDPSWRHGTYETAIFKRKADGTFWQASYRSSTDGETNELRDGSATIVRVYPKEVTTTIYEEQE